jgi:predicted membrane protein
MFGFNTTLERTPTKRWSIFGDVKRSGAWSVPARSRWETLFGDVVLDLLEARMTALEVTIEAGTVIGNVDLLVPEGIVVEVRRRTLFGDIRPEAGDAGPPGAPRIV